MSSQILEQTCPNITLILPTSPLYSSVRLIYQNDNTATPQAIAVPKTSHEVSRLVKAALTHSLKFSVRSGGHDIWGRSIISDGFVIDLREIKSVEISPDRKTAWIGGGIVFSDLAPALEEHGLMACMGIIGSVGYAGWAMFGGYGIFTNREGLGVDQIVGAEVVDCEGNVVEAEEERLKGIKGAGGNFGIVTRLRIKVFHLGPILAGTVLYTSTDIPIALHLYFQLIQSKPYPFPPSLQLYPSINNINLPSSQSPTNTLIISLIWSSSDHVLGRSIFQDLLTKLPPNPLSSTLMTTTATTLLNQMTQLVPSQATGTSNTISFSSFDTETLELLISCASNMPITPLGGGPILAFHHCNHPLSPSNQHHHPSSSRSSSNPTPTTKSVFPLHSTPHTTLEFISSVNTASSPTTISEAHEWGIKSLEKFRQTAKALPVSWIPLTRPGSRTMEQCYGKELWAEVRRLKDMFDPKGVFKCVPEF